MPKHSLDKFQHAVKESKKLSEAQKKKLLADTQGLSAELQEYEIAHPKLSKFIESVTTTLSNLGM